MMFRGLKCKCVTAAVGLLVAAAPAGAQATVTITGGPAAGETVSSSTVTFQFSSSEPVSGFTCSLSASALGFAFKPCTSPQPYGPLAPGKYFFSVFAGKGSATRSFTVGPLSGGGGAGATTGSGTGVGTGTFKPVKPTISGLAQSAPRWREGTTLASVSRAVARPPRGTTFRLSLNQPATLKLSFTRLIAGRRVGGRCVAQTSHNRHRHACNRTSAAGELLLAGAHQGINRVRFEGRLSAARKLKPGRYSMTVTAAAGGLASAARSLTFTIVG
jgi:hypothetical protein